MLRTEAVTQEASRAPVLRRANTLYNFLFVEISGGLDGTRFLLFESPRCFA